MRKTRVLENGFAYGGGKFMSWELVFDAIVQVSDAKTVEKLKKGITDRLQFEEALGDISMELGELLGVKVGPQYERRVKAKMKKLNDSVIEKADA
jgi:hypothetical protein